eukprot:CAMPEP_0168543698 /NCGR_PEP_ID=MMETSP0413-20121227/2031_1 /TAXON_ID=136452 /ORGANISM="Filamoeba nolandi, Strain NC-AS-23-1" /LENGTH=322 /DNA_ID=CAMNT_0008573681 /DNA_START=233 /DNA_END=1197 /DNA_ORIENTATION=+
MSPPPGSSLRLAFYVTKKRWLIEFKQSLNLETDLFDMAPIVQRKFLDVNFLLNSNSTDNDQQHEIGTWLHSVGLQQYTKLFAQQGITPDILDDLDRKDLLKMGVPVSDQDRILEAIQLIRAKGSRISLAPGCLITNKAQSINGTLGGFVAKSDHHYLLTSYHVLKALEDGIYHDGIQISSAKSRLLNSEAGCGMSLLEPGHRINLNVFVGGFAARIVGIRQPKNGDFVFKVGARTGITFGAISLASTSVRTNDHTEHTGFMVESQRGPFSESGDSGSLIFHFDEHLLSRNQVQVVGMLYAYLLTPKKHQTFCLDMKDVQTAL